MKRNTLSVLFIIFMISLTNGHLLAAPTQWTIESGGNGHFYWVTCVGPPGISWQVAKAAAEAEGGYLATITSREENEFVYSLLQDSCYWKSPPEGYNSGPWIGGYQPDGSSEPDGGWTWVTGEPWSFTAWLSGEPNNAGDEKYLHYYGMGIYGGPTWNDIGDPNLEYGYVVEYTPPERVDIDIKPGVYPNSIVLKSNGVISVAILTTADFDATTVDPTTVKFAGAAPIRKKMIDVNNDGYMDMLLNFNIQDLILNINSTEATLIGKTDSGKDIAGTDSVSIVPSKNKK